MKILVTGGNSRFATKLKQQNPDLYHTPGKDTLNLLNSESIKNYVSLVSEVDGIILNGNTGSPEPNDWFDVNQIESFKKLFDFNIIAPTQLIQQYLPNLKFVIALSTGLILKKGRVGEMYPYVFGKELLTNHIFRLSCQEKYKHIKMFSLDPGPMRNDDEYEYHSKLMYDIVHNLEKYENGEMYSIRGGDKF